jgi:hypothetical protein
VTGEQGSESCPAVKVSELTLKLKEDGSRKSPVGESRPREALTTTCCCSASVIPPAMFPPPSACCENSETP